MKKRHKKNQKKFQPYHLLLLMTILCIIFIAVSRFSNSSASGPVSYAAGYIIVPMQKGINKIGSALSDVSTYFKSKKHLEDENQKLTQRIASLESQVSEEQMNSHEYQQLQQLYKLDQSYRQYDNVAADVIAKDSGNWFSTFLINKGTKAGIKEGMNVVAQGGLVGLVTDAGPNYAKVRSIIDDESNVSVMDMQTSDVFIASGSLKTMNQKQMIDFSELKNTKSGKGVKEGDKIVTSAVSSRYLKGIPVGYIASVKTDSGNLTRSGTVVPVVDFEHLESVLVIKTEKNISDINSK